MYLIDTNVVSELRRARPHGGVLAWLASVDDRDLRLSAVTLGEIQAGVEITRAQNPTRAAEIETWLNQIAPTWNVVAMDGPTFRLWARLMHGRSDRLSEDAMIAATAKAHGWVVVTRNIKDFVVFGVPTLDPFMFGASGAP